MYVTIRKYADKGLAIVAVNVDKRREDAERFLKATPAQFAVVYDAAGVRVTSVYPGRTASPLQAKVHRQEGKDYDPGRWIDPESVATTVVMALDLPRDAEVNVLSVRPGRP